jgi:hypothetical protein
VGTPALGRDIGGEEKQEREKGEERTKGAKRAKRERRGGEEALELLYNVIYIML